MQNKNLQSVQFVAWIYYQTCLKCRSERKGKDKGVLSGKEIILLRYNSLLVELNTISAYHPSFSRWLRD